MTDQMIQRATILLQQRKFREAEAILGRLVTENPHNIDVMALYAESLLQQDKYDKAMEVVNNAIGLFPDVPHFFYQRARLRIYQERQYDEAEKDLQQAITLDPQEADYFALYALIKIDRKQFQQALELAEAGLEADPENIQALNARSTALLKLGRTEESFSSINGAFRHDPHNAYTHANHGWGLLEKGSAKEALQHFTEALRIDPNMELAQAGMAEALKARYFIYRIFMKFYFWMGNLTAKYQWGVIIGLYLISKVLQGVARTYPSAEPYVLPLIILLIAFAFSTWIISPLSNLFLRLNKYGRHLLDRNEILSSNFVGISLLLAAAGGAGALLTGGAGWVLLLFYGLTLMMPLGAMFSPQKKRQLLVIYTAALAATGAIAVALTFSGGSPWNIFSIVYAGGLLVFQWVANAIMIKQNNR
ncbi:tetratricopeptide repeat protein [Chitinophaga sp.]|uniref:tetratricopeptide repeat protein n=1 Tax=Chitinophaga sp. TaxID=1869181 RepID=UPI0031E40E88